MRHNSPPGHQLPIILRELLAGHNTGAQGYENSKVSSEYAAPYVLVIDNFDTTLHDRLNVGTGHNNNHVVLRGTQAPQCLSRCNRLHGLRVAPDPNRRDHLSAAWLECQPGRKPTITYWSRLMNDDLSSGFRLKEWEIWLLRNLFNRPGGITHPLYFARSHRGEKIRSYQGWEVVRTPSRRTIEASGVYAGRFGTLAGRARRQRRA